MHYAPSWRLPVEALLIHVHLPAYPPAYGTGGRRASRGDHNVRDAEGQRHRFRSAATRHWARAMLRELEELRANFGDMPAAGPG